MFVILIKRPIISGIALSGSKDKANGKTHSYYNPY
jgi:hypothetical protein